MIGLCFWEIAVEKSQTASVTALEPVQDPDAVQDEGLRTSVAEPIRYGVLMSTSGWLQPGFRSCDRQKARGAILTQRRRRVSAFEQLSISGAAGGALSLIATTCQSVK